MQIVEIEVPENNGVGICENCHTKKPVRKVEAFGAMRESRGWFNLCFDCFAPQMWWHEREGGVVWMSPAPNTVCTLTKGSYVNKTN